MSFRIILAILILCNSNIAKTWHIPECWQLPTLFAVSPFDLACLALHGLITQVVALHGFRYLTSGSAAAVHNVIGQCSWCLHDIEAWMNASRLRLNASQTVVLWLDLRHITDRLNVHEVQVTDINSQC